MKDVLFVCEHNAGRSQMAQPFFERDAPTDVRAEAAGTNPATVAGVVADSLVRSATPRCPIPRRLCRASPRLRAVAHADGLLAQGAPAVTAGRSCAGALADTLVAAT